MAVAAWLVWRQGGLWQWPLALFAVQLALNAAWSWLFFGFHLPGAAFIEIVALFAAIAATTIAFWPKSMAAGILMLPYLGWVGFATRVELHDLAAEWVNDRSFARTTEVSIYRSGINQYLCKLDRSPLA